MTAVASSREASGLTFRLLGPVEAWRGDRVIPLGGAKQRGVLAQLLLAADRVVSVDRLLTGLWGATPPPGAKDTLHVYIRNLRRVIEGRRARPDEYRVIVSQSPGYQLCLDGAAFDLAGFRHDARTGKEAATRQSWAEASRALGRGLSRWQSPILSNVADLPFAASATATLEEERWAAWEAWVDTELALSRHEDLVAELEATTAREPLRERPWAQLMLALYRSGRQADAAAAYQQLRSLLVDEIGQEPSAPVRRLHEQVLAQDPVLELAPTVPTHTTGTREPARTRERRQGNLPELWNSFVGRDEAIAAIHSLIGTSRLLTLTGPGGCGKTRLAIETARSLQEGFADGAWLVDLSVVTRPEQVRAAIGAALQLRAPSRDDDAALAEALSSQQALLVLDNCEHLLPRVAEIAATLLWAAPGLRVLATSRERLNTDGETVWRVPSLATTREDGAEEAAAAVRLLADRARDVVDDFELGSHSARVMEEICARLDGIPLAIELAAPRLAVLSPEQLLSRLDDRFAMLQGGPSMAPSRHRTLRATIDWSWALLDDRHRTLLRRLAVFPGQFDLDQVTGVCAGDGLQKDSLLEVLAGLIDRSLVTTTGVGAVHHYRLLAIIRQYALERLTEAGEVRALRDHHLAWHLALAEQAADSPQATLLQRWHPWDREALDGFGAAIEWADESGQDDAFVTLAGSLGVVWKDLGVRWEGSTLADWVQRALSRSSAAGVRARALAHFAEAFLQSRARPSAWEHAAENAAAATKLFAEAGDRRGHVRARFLHDYSVLGATDQFPEMLASLDELQALSDGQDDIAMVAECLRIRSLLLREMGDYDGALAAARSSERAFTALGLDAGAAAAALAHCAASLAAGSDPSLVATRCEASTLALHEDHEHGWLMAVARRLQGDTAGAKEWAAQNVQGCQQSGYLLGEVTLRNELAAIALLERDARTALTHAIEAQNLMGDDMSDDRLIRSITLERIASAALDLGDAVTCAIALGTAVHLRDISGVALPVYDRAPHERTMAAARHTLGDLRFEELLTQGRTISPTALRARLDQLATSSQLED